MYEIYLKIFLEITKTIIGWKSWLSITVSITLKLPGVMSGDNAEPSLISHKPIAKNRESYKGVASFLKWTVPSDYGTPNSSSC